MAQSFFRVSARCLGLAIGWLPYALALYSEGSVVVPSTGIVFLEKFAFTFDPAGTPTGTVHLQVRASAGDRPITVVLFDDEVGSYSGPSGESWATLSCEERLGRAKDWREFSWHKASSAEGLVARFAVSQKLRPRWWYVALADCSGADEAVEHSALTVTWRLHLQNPPYGWSREFSADQCLAPQIAAVLALACAGLLLLQWRAHRRLICDAAADSASRKGADPFARLLLVGLTLALSETVASLVHYMHFASDGVGAPWVFLTSQLLASGSNFVLASILLLVSEGRCISYVMVSSDAWRMLRRLGPFLAACLLLEVWGENSGRRAYTTDYVYTTPCGWILVVLDLVLLALYSASLRRTLATEGSQEDRRFYCSWGLVYALWFLALPLTAVLARTVLAPYAWFVVSVAVKKGATLLVYASLIAGLWPGSAASAHFRTLHAAGTVTRKLPAPAIARFGPASPELPGLLFSRRWQPERAGCPLKGIHKVAAMSP